MKKVLLAPYFGLGHSMPFIAMAAHMRGLGLEPYLAAEPAALERGAEAGCKPLELPPDVVEIATTVRGITTTEEFAEALSTLAQRSAPFLRKALGELGAEGVVTDSLHLGAGLAAEASGLPWASAAVTPFELSPAMAAGSQAIIPTAELRQSLGLPETDRNSLQQGLSPTLHILPWTPDFDLAAPPPASKHVGTLVLDPDPLAESLDEAVKRFVDTPKPKVLVTATSSPIDAADPMVEEFLNDAAEALGSLDVAGLVSINRSMALEQPVPDHVLVSPFLPHAAILPHCDFIVTNGGWGTVSRTLALGIPVVMVPIFLDQPCNAELCTKLGVARALEYEDLTPEDLAALLQEVLDAPESLQSATATCRATMRELGGAPEAARAIAAML